MPKKKIQKRTSSKPVKPNSHVAYDLLLGAIENGRLQPGSRLREVELAERFGISRTPVREAIKRLETQGLVTHEPNQGAVITKLDYARTVELYLVREVLEGAGARLAATLATQAELGVLRTMMEEHRGFLNDPEELVHCDRLFHKQIQLTARNHFLNDILDNLRISQILMTGTTLAVQARPAALLDEHEAIVDAIVARDPDKAESAARLHVRNAFAARLKLYADQQRAAL